MQKSQIILRIYKYFNFDINKNIRLIILWQSACSGGVSAVIAGVITNPIDVIKTRKMT